VFGFVDSLLFRPAGVGARPRDVGSPATQQRSIRRDVVPDFIVITGEASAFESVAAEDDSRVAPIRIGDEVERADLARVGPH
jgi:hypothetical protein